MSMIEVNLVVEIDTEAWAEDYGIELIKDARADIKQAIALNSQDWLNGSLGYAASTVRVAS